MAERAARESDSVHLVLDGRVVGRFIASRTGSDGMYRYRRQLHAEDMTVLLIRAARQRERHLEPFSLVVLVTKADAYIKYFDGLAPCVVGEAWGVRRTHSAASQ